MEMGFITEVKITIVLWYLCRRLKDLTSDVMVKGSGTFGCVRSLSAMARRRLWFRKAAAGGGALRYSTGNRVDEDPDVVGGDL